MALDYSVFVSSPKEVKHLRKVALRVADELATSIAKDCGVILKAHDRDSVPPTAMHRNKGEVAEDGILKHDFFKSCDRIVIILWRRLGSPTDSAISDTVQEFEKAHASFQRVGRPRISVYFKEVDPICEGEPCSQLQGLLDFKRRIREMGILWTQFEQDSDFEGKFRNDMADWVQEIGRRRHAPVPIPSGVADWHRFSGWPDNVTDRGHIVSDVVSGKETVLIRDQIMAGLQSILDDKSDSSVAKEAQTFAHIAHHYLLNGQYEAAWQYADKAREAIGRRPAPAPINVTSTEDSLFTDFDLAISRLGNQYGVHASSRIAGEAPRIVVDPTMVHLHTMDDPQTIGQMLFDTVFSGEILACFRRSVDGARSQHKRLRVRIRLSEIPELAELPWEYLYDNRWGHIALTPDIVFVRYLESIRPVKPLMVAPPLGILTVIATPTDLPQFDAEREWSALRETLEPLCSRGLLEMQRLEPATPRALFHKLNSRQYHVLHFIGHGGLDQTTQQSYIFFEDKCRSGSVMDAETLAIGLGSHPAMRLVFLNACFSGRSTNHATLSGFAFSLVRHGIPSVIAMREAVSDSSALIFSDEFYNALAATGRIDDAMNRARMMMRFLNLREWGAPMLFMHSLDGRLW